MMEILKKKERNEAHPYIPELKDLYRKGHITRREFLRNTTLLGMSLVSASAFLSACAQEEEVTQEPTEPAATAPPASEIRRGGTFRWASYVQPVDHPAKISWGPTGHIVGCVAERLTTMDSNGISRPLLLEKWEPSEDVETWTLHLRKGIKFHHGPELMADDVIFNFEQWLDEEVGSSLLGMIGAYLSPENIEKVDDYTVKLHLDRPEIAVPEHLLHYPAVILPKDFEGDWIKEPYGTGPFELEEYVVGERVKLTAYDDYWQMGIDGKPLPYVDAVDIFDLGEERSAIIAAFESGQIDTNSEPKVEDYLALKDNPGINIESLTVAQTAVLGMRVDVDPWTDNRVRKALKLCQRRKAILDTALYGEGEVGHDTHTASIHPAYCEKPIPEYDPEKAKALLEEAGYPDGLDVTITVPSSFPATVSYAETLKAAAEPAGFNITIKTVPGSDYWASWTELPLKITEWGHRPLGTMVFSLAYTSDKEGNPVAWNETHWVDEEFDELLAEASATLDVEERREIMCKLEEIQMERGSAGIAYFSNIWRITSERVRNMPAHPMQYEILTDVWLAEEA
jgi:peptide/nickel transport system substrate-binding protein